MTRHGPLFPLGITTVTATVGYTDGGSPVSESATFYVDVRDTTPPVITPPPATTLVANRPGGADNTLTASGHGRCDLEPHYLV